MLETKSREWTHYFSLILLKSSKRIVVCYGTLDICGKVLMGFNRKLLSIMFLVHCLVCTCSETSVTETYQTLKESSVTGTNLLYISIVNLKAASCPENTIQDIHVLPPRPLNSVRTDAEQIFVSSFAYTYNITAYV